ncbi:MAG: prepilin-type N-terminal cleavage/methylation domain-containing protein [Gemmataceae bacterium]|nr:prepilin-type N-terminal cleavage/methylation domain-containing protein [Gemmataceae bacterium]
MTTRHAARRAGFTMVELLVVILIIGVLASLLLAGFGAARTSARKAQAATEIAQVADAVAAFKAKMNVGHIPAFRPGTTDGSLFRLKKMYVGDEPEFAYLRQVFPQIDTADNGWTGGDQTLAPNQVLLFFLTGIDLQGFSTNRAKPFTPSTGSDNRVPPFLTLKTSNIRNGFFVDPWDTPYAYFAFDPALNNYPVNTGTPLAVAWPTTTTTHPVDGTMIAPNGVRAFRSGGKFLNARGFQIVSAGPDTTFGGGGDWAPGTGDYVSNGIGGDDLSNFNTGPLNQENK